MKRVYTSLAALYDTLHHIQTLWADQRHREQAVALLSLVRPNAILEVGAGTGLTTQLLHRKMRRSRITAVDISEKMLERHAARTRRLRCKRLQIDIAGGWDLYDRFDAVISTYCLGGVRDVDRAMINIHRALKPEGFLCLCEMVAPPKKESHLLYHVHKSIVEPIVFFIWGFSDLNLENLVTRHGFDVIENYYRSDRLLGSTSILLAKKKLS